MLHYGKSRPCVQSSGEAYKADAKVGTGNLNLNCRGLSSGVPMGDKKCVVDCGLMRLDS